MTLVKGAGEKLVSAFNQRPGAFFLAVLVGQTALWTLAPSLTYRSVPLDVAENIAWGKEWQLGYYAHPPLQAWLTMLAISLSGWHAWSVYLLSQAAIVLTYVPLFLLGREAAGPKAGVLAVLAFSLIYYANWPSPEFNANVVQMPIWPFAALALWRGATTGRFLWWIVLGVTAALAVYAKYSAVILFGALIATSLAVAECRAAYRTAGPYAAVAIAMALISPHVIWLWTHDFLPIKFAERRAGAIDGFALLIGPAQFLGAQVLDLAAPAAVLFVGGVADGLLFANKDGVSFDSAAGIRQFIVWMAAAPYALTVLFSVSSGFGLRDMWAAPMPVWISLAAVLLLRPVYRHSRLQLMLATWGVLFVGLPLVHIIYMSIAPARLAIPPRASWPSRALAEQLEATWRQYTKSPLKIVAGDKWPADFISFYAPDHPSVFVAANYAYNPWITGARLAADGVLVVWDKTATNMVPDRYAQFGPFAAVGTVSAPFDRTPGATTATVGWALRLPGLS